MSVHPHDDPAPRETPPGDRHAASTAAGRGCVSVVIPVYRAADFLARAVDSVLQQPEVGEVLLIEDGSPDDSLAVCKQLAEADMRVRLLRHPGGVNRGAGASRNLGITAARGEFIAFLDADDYYLPGRFERDLRLLLEQPALDGVYSAIGTVFYDEAGRARYAGKGQDERHLTTMHRRIQPEDLFSAMAPVGDAGHFHADGLTVRRRVFGALDGFDTELELSQDTLLFLQMALKCRLAPAELERAVAMRGVHTANRVADEKRLRHFRVILFRKLYRWMREQGIGGDRLGRVWALYYNCAGNADQGPGLLFALKHLLRHPEVFVSGAFWHRVQQKWRRTTR